MSDSNTDFPKQWFIEIATCQAYGHQQFSQQVAMPNSWIEPDSTHQQSSANSLKAHPITEHVYFSGVPEANQLPTESDKAKNKYHEYKLSMKKSLSQTFNPKPQ